MSRSLIVGISDMNASRDPDVLVTYALGSCVGICLYDAPLKVGGLAHIMLPDSRQFTSGAINRMKFADTAIVDLLGKMRSFGADRTRIKAKIAGGAKMFQVQGGGPTASIGDRNVDSVKQILHALRIPILGEDTRKDYGRSVFFHLDSGVMEVRSLNKSISRY